MSPFILRVDFYKDALSTVRLVCSRLVGDGMSSALASINRAVIRRLSSTKPGVIQPVDYEVGVSPDTFGTVTHCA